MQHENAKALLICIFSLHKFKPMNVRIFQNRLDGEHLHQDQDALNNFMEQVTVKKTATQFVPGEPDYWSILVFYEEGKPKRAMVKEPEKLSVEPDEALTPEEIEVFNALKQWRRDKANVLNVPEYLICHNSDFASLSRIKPRTMDDLAKIKGFGPSKVAKHGDEIISVLNAF